MKNTISLKNILLTIASLIAVFAFGATAIQADTPLQNAIDYLNSQSNSADRVIALASVNESVDISFLKGKTSNKAIDYAKPIMAIVSGGEDPRSYPNEDMVAKMMSFEDGGQIGNPDTLNDTVWGILALRSAGIPRDNSLLQSSKQFILDNQNSDGGWSWSTSGGSSTDDTAIAVIALLEMGMSPLGNVISNAKEYIKGNQNKDGGFASDPTQSWGIDSNASSTAWVIMMINKLGESISSWSKNESSPKEFIISLQDEDGGIWWVLPGSSDFNNKAPTADSVIALSGNSHPVVKMDEQTESDSANDDEDPPAGGEENPQTNGEEESNEKVSFRIEGGNEQICKGEVEVENALEVIEKGALVCGYEYVIEDTDFGPYLSSLAGEDAEGMDGWMYFVNWLSPSVGAGDYILDSGDKVLWYFGDWQWKPARLTLESNNLEVGDVLSGKIEYIDDGSWSPLKDAEVLFNGDIYSTDNSGEFSIEISNNGVFEVVAKKDGYIRSDKKTVTVGELSQEILLSVNIVEDEIEEPEAAFTVSATSLAFGSLKPGQTSSQNVTLSNTGKKDLSVSANVSGDSIFFMLKIANILWSSFESILLTNQNKNVATSLSIPSDFSLFGEKEGKLIFWGSVNE